MDGTTNAVLAYIKKLQEVASPAWYQEFLENDQERFMQLESGFLHLLEVLGTGGEHWRKQYDVGDPPSSYEWRIPQILGILKALTLAIECNLLFKVEQLVMSEAFNNLLEQADYLFGENYFLAAGVLGRAVLEEHLRKLSDLRKCAPERDKPTIADFTQSLYKAQVLSKIEMKHVEALAAIGNNAAHNLPVLKRDDVARLLRDVRHLISQHPLSE